MHLPPLAVAGPPATTLPCCRLPPLLLLPRGPPLACAARQVRCHSTAEMQPPPAAPRQPLLQHPPAPWPAHMPAASKRSAVGAAAAAGRPMVRGFSGKRAANTGDYLPGLPLLSRYRDALLFPAPSLASSPTLCMQASLPTHLLLISPGFVLPLHVCRQPPPRCPRGTGHLPAGNLDSSAGLQEGERGAASAAGHGIAE
jgi:hypothetical protein